MPRTYHTFDLIILGGGTAGLSALQEAKKHTENVVLINDGPTNTTCAQTGCMPSKSLIHSARLYHERHKMAEAGIRNAEKLQVDIPEVLKTVRKKRKYFIDEIHKEMHGLQAHVLQAKGRFETPTTVRANGRLLHTKATVVATGASPSVPPELKEIQDKVITTDSLFECKNLPKRMAVIGLGPVGLEMAQALARLGIEITAVERNGHVGGVADADINKVILSVLRKDMRVWMGTKAKFERSGTAILMKSKDDTVEVDAVLSCVGRKPNLGSLGLNRLGASMDDEGVPHFNRHTMQLHNLPIYIAGDATDERMILHEASDEGKRAAYHAITGKNDYRQKPIPLAIIFTHPTIALIGDSHYAMRWNGVNVGEASFDAQGRATIENEAQGKIRIAANSDDGRLRGCEMMAPQGEHLAHLMAFALEQQLTVKEMLKMPFYHPSFEEAVRTALKALIR